MYLYSHDIFHVLHSYCVNFKLSCRFDTILFLVTSEMFKFCLVRPCGHSLSQTEEICHSHMPVKNLCFFFLKLLSLGKDFRSEAKDMALYLCAIYKG